MKLTGIWYFQCSADLSMVERMRGTNMC